MSPSVLRGLRLAARRARSRRHGRALILGYHRIADEPDDPHGLCVSPTNFDEHLAVLCRVAHPIGLEELVGGVDSDAVPRGAVALTFDDGYADVLYGARPLLERHGVPATVFLVSGALGAEFWWDAVDRLTAVGVRAGGGGERRRALYDRVFPLAGEAKAEVLARVESELRGEADRGVALERPDPGQRRPLRVDEARQLTDGDLIQAGAHTVTHPALGGLPASEARHEIRRSRVSLERILGRPVRAFAYPHGSLSPAVVAEVRAGGYRLACGSESDGVGAQTDPFRLPRLWPPDVDGHAFERWLRAWLPR